MAIKIKFDSTYNPIAPTLVLATRSGDKLGVLPAIGVDLCDNLQYPELSFKVQKYNNGEEYYLWDEIRDFRLVWCAEWDIWFEISVEMSDGDSTEKNVTARSIGVAELSQINIYDTEINTETDIARADYVPTVLYNANDANASLLNRIMGKAPHYSIKHVDATIANIQRTFSFDNVAIFDAFQTIAKEIHCLFVIDSGSNADGSIARKISVFDLETNCMSCGHRGSFLDKCPECGSTDIKEGYGEDTSIIVSVDNLADDITYSTNVDSVKNCFKVQGGDELMNAAVVSCNPSGSAYIWYITDELKADMSSALRAKIDEYNAAYESVKNDLSIQLDSSLVNQYNALVRKYKARNSNLNEITNPIVGYPALMKAYYDSIDFALFLRSGMMPAPSISGTTAAQEGAKLTSNALSPIAVTNLETCSTTTASSAVLSIAKTLVRSDYQVKVKTSSYSNGTWAGLFVLTSYSDEEDTFTTGTISVTITDDYSTYLQQRINKMLDTKSNDATDIKAIFKKNDTAFQTEIEKYCLDSLNGFYDACQACMDILIQQGVANQETWAEAEVNLYEVLYLPYYNKSQALSQEILLREGEIATVDAQYDENDGILVDGLKTTIEKKNDEIHASLNFEAFIGPELWTEFVSYRREDLYQNDNYISDGLNNAELIDRAQELLQVASEEIYKSANLQHVLNASLKNLLVMQEFQPLVESFQIGNWLRLIVDDSVYKLRLVSYEINFDNLKSLHVEFSDVVKVMNGLSDIDSILSRATSMATSYDSVKRQAKKGSEGKKYIDDWVGLGLAMTQMKIVNNAQNQDFLITDHGVLCREYLPITDSYDDAQMKIINKGIYLTDDGWLTSRAGIGNFIYYDPFEEDEEKVYKESYGVIADTLVGNLILSHKVGIYNEGSYVTMDKDGLILTARVGDENNIKLFRVRKEYSDGTLEDNIWMDSDGNAHFKGDIWASALHINNGDSYVDISSYIDASQTAQDLRSSIKITASEIRTEMYAAGSTLYSFISQTASGIYSEVGNTASGLYTYILQTAEEVRIAAATTDSSLYAFISVTAGEIRSEVGDTISGIRSYISQRADAIETSVATTDSRLYSHILQTASEIRSEVGDTASGIMSYISQRADAIETSVATTDSRLYARILQTASEIRTEVGDTISGIRSYISQTAGAIETSVATTDSRLYSKIMQTASEIRSEVGMTISGIRSYITQTAKDITSTVGAISVTVSDLNTRVEEIEGSTIYQNREEIAAAVGSLTYTEEYVVDPEGEYYRYWDKTLQKYVYDLAPSGYTGTHYRLDKKLHIIDGVGLVMDKTEDGATTSFGVYNSDTLTAGVMVEKINGDDSVVKISADRVDLGNYATVGMLDANYVKSNYLTSNYITASQISASYANIETFNSTKAKIDNLTTDSTRTYNIYANQLNGYTSNITGNNGSGYGLTVTNGISAGGNVTIGGSLRVTDGGTQYYVHRKSIIMTGAFVTGSKPVFTSSTNDIDLTHYHAITATEGTGTNAGKILITLGGPQTTEGSTNFNIAATQFYKNGVAAAASNVTLSDTGWQPSGSRVISASNGASKTVTLPTFKSDVSAFNANTHKATANFWSDSFTNILKSQEVDATDVYTAGVTVGWSSGNTYGWNQAAAAVATPHKDTWTNENANKQATFTYPISGGSTATKTYTMSVSDWGGDGIGNAKQCYAYLMETSDGAAARLTVDATSVYNAGNTAGQTTGWNNAAAISVLPKRSADNARFTATIPTSGGGTSQKVYNLDRSGSWSNGSKTIYVYELDDNQSAVTTIAYGTVSISSPSNYTITKLSGSIAGRFQVSVTVCGKTYTSGDIYM